MITLLNPRDLNILAAFVFLSLGVVIGTLIGRRK